MDGTDPDDKVNLLMKQETETKVQLGKQTGKQKQKQIGTLIVGVYHEITTMGGSVEDELN